MPLTPVDLTLKTYTGQKVVPKGKFKVTVKYKAKHFPDLEIYVLPNGGPPLLGREWIRRLQLDWHSIHAINCDKVDTADNAGTTPERLADILAKAADVFQEGLGTLKGMKALITIDRHATPKFCKARPVPYAIRPAVEEELRNLEKTGVLSRVNHSDWATPIVPVLKKPAQNKPGEPQKIRICGDFKVTINPVLETVRYPLPLIQDIFASLRRGKRFTKLIWHKRTYSWRLQNSLRST